MTRFQRQSERENQNLNENILFFSVHVPIDHFISTLTIAGPLPNHDRDNSQSVPASLRPWGLYKTIDVCA